MIGHFPDPYSDELLYSVFARFSDRMAYPSKKSVILELFGTENVMAVVDFPSHLDSFITVLPPGCSYTADHLIDDHTLLPFYGPFLPAERLKLIRSDMHNDRGTSIATRVGTVASGIPLPRLLRFCLQCVEEDRKNWGECYWHRVHQVPCVFICPVHSDYLQESNAPIRNVKTKYEFISAEHMLRTLAKQVSAKLSFRDKVLLHIAEDTAWLLKQHQITHGPEVLQKKYLAILADRGLLMLNGKVRVDDLIRSFKGYYSSEILNLLHCNVDENMIDNWLTRLLRSSGKLQGAQHPIHHLLLIHFLGYRVGEFFSVREERNLFGAGPWPCLNRAGDHYKQLTILHCDVGHDPSTTGGVLATFSCYCGFIYTQKGPDTTIEGQYQISRIKSHGDMRQAKLQLLWDDPTVSLEQAATLLGTCRETLKKYAILSGLSFPRLYEKQRKIVYVEKPSSSVNDLELYRTEWLVVLQEYPKDRIQLLWRKREGLRSVYIWLHKNDKKWLEAHMPIHEKWKKQSVPLPLRVDWEIRDLQLAEKVKESALRLKSTSERPTQVSITAIGRDIGEVTLLQKRLYKLPITAKALLEVAETHEDCGVRRIWWALALYQQESIIPTEQQLIRRAYVRDMVEAPNVKEAVDAALRSFKISKPILDSTT